MIWLLGAVAPAALAVGAVMFGVGAVVVVKRRAITDFASATLPAPIRRRDGIRSLITFAFSAMGLLWMAIGLGTCIAGL